MSNSRRKAIKSYADAYKTLSELDSIEFNKILFQDRYCDYFLSLLLKVLKAQESKTMPEHEVELWRQFEDEYHKSPNQVMVHLPTELVLMYIDKIEPDYFKTTSSFDLDLILGSIRRGNYHHAFLARMPLEKAYSLLRKNSIDVSDMKNFALPYLATLPVAARMQELLKCRHSIKYAMKVPAVFEGILDLFPDQQSRRALILNEKWNDDYYAVENLVDMAVDGYEVHPDSLRMILAELTREELKEKVNFEKILHHPRLFAVYFEMLDVDLQREFLNHRDKHGNCALHYAASRGEVFAPVLAEYERLFGRERILSELMLQNQKGETPLHVAEAHEDTLAMAWSYFRGREFQAAMTPNRSGDVAINLANTKEAMLQVLDLYHPNMRIAAVTSESHGRWLANDNPMETASRSLDWLLAVLDMLPPHDQPTAMRAAGETSIATLQEAANDADKITFLLGLYPQENRLEVLKKRCRNYGSGFGEDVNLLACMKKPEVIMAVMDLLTPADQVKMLNANRVGYKAFVVDYARENIIGCMEVIDHLKNDEDKLKLLRFDNGMYFHGAEIFVSASRNLPILQKLFAIVPPEERLQALGQCYDPNFPCTNDLRYRHLYNLAGNLTDHKSIKTIIGMLLPSQRLEGLLTRRHENDGEWGKVISYYQHKEKLPELMDLFSILSKDDISEILTRKIDVGFDERAKSRKVITLREAINADKDLRQQFVAMMQEKSVGSITASQSSMYQPADDRSSDAEELLREVKKVKI